VSLRILFADDSMTAQNMGKKILSEAGYDVVAVSNGAAAVKKIAEQKPDIIILDVYMPGYSGLEVCEKVRGSLETLKIPVLLTVGKMEPYKPEDANRVKADGVIIKPFEASDLLAIIKKFEERIGSAPPPPMAQPVVAQERPEEDAVAVQAETAVDHQPASKAVGQPMVEVPDHMANSAAFGDFLGGEPAHESAHFAVNTPSAAFETSVIVPAPPVPVTENEIPVSWKHEETKHEETKQEETKQEETPEQAVAAPAEASLEAVAVPIEAVPEIVAAPVETAEVAVEHPPEPAAVSPEAAIEPGRALGPESAPEPELAPGPELALEPPHPQFIPVFKEPEPASGGYEVMPTSAPPITDLEIPREPALQETAEEVTRSTVVDRVEPGLMSTIGQQVEAFPNRPMEMPSDAPAAAPAMDVSPAAATGGVAEASVSLPLPAAEPAAQLTDADFEARVAAAMAAYSHSTEAETPSAVEPAAQAVPAEEPRLGVATDVYVAHAVAAEPQAASATVPSFEYEPAAGAAKAAPRIAEPAPATAEPQRDETYAEHVAPAAQPVAHGAELHKTAVAASVEAALPEAAAAAAAEFGEDHHTIAQAVHRAMERLKPDLVQEIMKELKAKK
jgi:CheY-like chemotaxis protein